jgi:hypothetical protein
MIIEGGKDSVTVNSGIVLEYEKPTQLMPVRLCTVSYELVMDPLTAYTTAKKYV